MIEIIDSSQFISGKNNAFDVSQFNAVSRRAQEITGVDPSKCISLRQIPGDDFASPVLFMSSLSVREFATPVSRETAKGWDRSRHDEVFHYDRIRTIHPDTAGFIGEVADHGLDVALKGNLDEAVKISKEIDIFLSDVPQLWSEYLYTFMRRLGRIDASNTGIRVGLLRTQDEHTKAIQKAVNILATEEVAN